jgi:hypothetical protein
MEDPEDNVEPGETPLQERPLGALTDDSLPAAQIIRDQSGDSNENPAPRFIP